MAKGEMPEGVKTTMYWVLGIGIIALVGLVMLILFGNLSGNVGFTSGTQGYNDTQGLINNYTQSVTNTGKQFPVVGTIVGIALLLVILIGILTFAVKKLMGVTNGADSNGSFG
jgi:multisubunit Na+/H+ antiporter MnhB subunit